MKKKYESPKAEWISFLIADDLASGSTPISQPGSGGTVAGGAEIKEDNVLFGIELLPTIPE